MQKDVELAVRMTADAHDVSAAFDSAGTAAKAMADDVEKASRTASRAADDFEQTGSAAENMDDKFGRATGALGALTSGFDLVGLSAFSEGLGQVSMATDFVSGTAQSLMLITELESLALVRAKAAAHGKSVADRAMGVASKAAAAGQWLLNAALSANPVGLVVIAVIALVAAVVIAYKKSETFRTVVNAVMKAVKLYIFGVVLVVKELIGWVADKAPAAWDKLKDSAVSAAKWIADKLGRYFDLITSPIQTVIDLVDRLLDKISSIHLPDIDLPDLNPFGKSSVFGRTVVGGSGPDPGASSSAGGSYIDARTYVTVSGSGIVDEAAVARTLEPVLARQATRLGQLLTPAVPA